MKSSYLFLAAVIAIAPVVNRPASAAPLTKGPYLQAPGATTMTIMWEAAAREPAVLRFGEGDRLDREVGPIVPAIVHNGAQEMFVYEASLRGLKPGTGYGYEARCGADRSEPRHFRTFDPSAAQVTFIAYGDSRTNPERHRAVVAHFRQQTPDFILHSGDLVAKGREYSLWGREFFEPLHDVIDEVPMLPSIGNHEQDGVNYLAYFHEPGSQRFFYSCDIGPVHVLTLDYRHPEATHEQFAFVAADLKATQARWKIVLLHYPMFNLGGHTEAWGHENYLPLFRTTHVDVVVAGHSHLYERFQPLRPRGQPDAWVIQHVTSGGGGASLAASVPDPALAATFSQYHFVLFKATGDTLAARTINAEGGELDAFTLCKDSAGRQPKEYVAAAQFEEDVADRIRALRTKKAAAAAEKAAVTPAAKKQ